MSDGNRSPDPADAGLRYIEPGTPGYRRARRGRGFSYLGTEGEVINGKARERAKALAIPPAWENVWISKDPKGHILATGNDAAGRKQYIYHPLWEELRDEVKFDRLAPLGARLPRFRAQMDRDLRRHGLPRPKVVALAVAVLDRTLVRVGNMRYVQDNQSYGLTTLTEDHVEISGTNVHLEFTGKGGAELQLVFRDRRLASLVSRCTELSGQTLFSYDNRGGESAAVTSTDVNAYLSEALGGPFTAKDFRTWGASSLVTGELGRSSDPAQNDNLIEALDHAAERLGNTRETCRDSYVHPRIEEAAADGTLKAAWRRARPGKWINRDESALRLLLNGA